MSNINDYLMWRGDIELDSKNRLNEVDSMIMARFSYLRFDKIKMNKEETIETVSTKMKDLKNEEFLYNGDKDLITNLGQSIRFKDMEVTDYIKTNEKELEKQFGAVTVHLSDKEMYISFIGTDSTVYGWKEDFNMAFMDSVPCQVSGKEYVEKVAAKYPDKKIRIGGHSKGGNVAIYSALTASKEIQNRIIKVYNYDGPGFNKEVINKYKTSSILQKIETYLPQDSMIGRIMTHEEKCTISYSIEKGIYQHDIYSWQVIKDDIVKSEKNTESSEDMNRTVTDWLEITTPQQRKVFIDSVFELFYATDAKTFGEISNNLTTSIPLIFKKYREISSDEKQIVTDMIKAFATSYLSVVKEKGSEKFDITKEKYLSRFKKK